MIIHDNAIRITLYVILLIFVTLFTFILEYTCGRQSENCLITESPHLNPWTKLSYKLGCYAGKQTLFGDVVNSVTSLYITAAVVFITKKNAILLTSVALLGIASFLNHCFHATFTHTLDIFFMGQVVASLSFMLYDYNDLRMQLIHNTGFASAVIISMIIQKKEFDITQVIVITAVFFVSIFSKTIHLFSSIATAVSGLSVLLVGAVFLAVDVKKGCHPVSQWLTLHPYGHLFVSVGISTYLLALSQHNYKKLPSV